MEKPFDNTDKNIVDILRKDPRITNKNIAKQLALAETTIALRIKNMGDRGLMRVIAQQNVISEPYTSLCFMFVNTSGRTVQKVCEDVSKLEQVFSVSQGIGNPDIFVNARTVSLDDARALSSTIAAIKGVSTIEVIPSLRVHRFDSAVGDLSVDLQTLGPPSEDLNQGIFKILVRDGRTSNREVARQLGSSEGAVRQRLKKMQLNGALRFQVVCSPQALGQATIAVVRIKTIANQADDVVSALLSMPEFGFIGEVSGEFNVLALASTEDSLALGNLCDNRLLSIKGVTELQVQLLVANMKHEYHLAHFNTQTDAAD